MNLIKINPHVAAKLEASLTVPEPQPPVSAELEAPVPEPEALVPGEIEQHVVFLQSLRDDMKDALSAVACSRPARPLAFLSQHFAALADSKQPCTPRPVTISDTNRAVEPETLVSAELETSVPEPETLVSANSYFQDALVTPLPNETKEKEEMNVPSLAAGDWHTVLQDRINLLLKNNTTFENIVSAILRGTASEDNSDDLNELAKCAKVTADEVGFKFYIIAKTDDDGGETIGGLRTYHDDLTFNLDTVQRFSALQNVRHGIFLYDNDTNRVNFAAMFGRLFRLMQAWLLSTGKPEYFAEQLFRQCRRDHPDATALLAKLLCKLDGSTALAYGQDCIKLHTNRNYSLPTDMRVIVEKHVPDMHALVVELTGRSLMHRGQFNPKTLELLVSNMVLSMEVVKGTCGPHPGGSIKGVGLLRMTCAAEPSTSKAQDVFANTDFLAELLDEMYKDGTFDKLRLGNVFAIDLINLTPLVLKDPSKTETELEKKFVQDFVKLHQTARRYLLDADLLKAIYDQSIPVHVEPEAQRPFEETIMEGFVLACSLVLPQQQHPITSDGQPLYTTMKIISPIFLAMSKHFKNEDIDAKNAQQAKFMKALALVAGHFASKAKKNVLHYDHLVKFLTIESVNDFRVNFDSASLLQLKNAWVVQTSSQEAILELATKKQALALKLHDKLCTLQLDGDTQLSPADALKLLAVQKTLVRECVTQMIKSNKSIVNKLADAIVIPIQTQINTVRDNSKHSLQLDVALSTLHNWCHVAEETKNDGDAANLTSKQKKDFERRAKSYISVKNAFNIKMHERAIPLATPFSPANESKLQTLNTAVQAIRAKQEFQPVDVGPFVVPSTDHLATVLAELELNAIAKECLEQFEKDFGSFGQRGETVTAMIMHEHLKVEEFRPDAIRRLVNVYLTNASDIHAMNTIVNVKPPKQEKEKKKNKKAEKKKNKEAEKKKQAFGAKFKDNVSLEDGLGRVDKLVDGKKCILTIDMDSTLMAKLINASGNQWSGHMYRGCAVLTAFMRKFLLLFATLPNPDDYLFLLNTGACQHTNLASLLEICNRLLQKAGSVVQFADGFVGDRANSSMINSRRKLYITVRLAQAYPEKAVFAFDDMFAQDKPSANSIPSNLFLFPVLEEALLGSECEQIVQALLIFTCNASGAGKSTSVKELSNMLSDFLFANGDTGKHLRGKPNLLKEVGDQMRALSLKKLAQTTFVCDFLGSGISLEQEIKDVHAVRGVQTIVPPAVYETIVATYGVFVPYGDAMRDVYSELLEHFVSATEFKLRQKKGKNFDLGALLRDYVQNGGAIDNDLAHAKLFVSKFVDTHAEQMLSEAQQPSMYWTGEVISGHFFEQMAERPLAAAVALNMVFVWRRDHCVEPADSTSYSSVDYNSLMNDDETEISLLRGQWVRFLTSCLSHATSTDDESNDEDASDKIAAQPKKSNKTGVNMEHLAFVWEDAQTALDTVDNGPLAAFESIRVYVDALTGAQTVLSNFADKKKRANKYSGSKKLTVGANDKKSKVVGMFVLPFGYTRQHIKAYAQAINDVHSNKKKAMRYSLSNGFIGLVYVDENGVRRHVTLRFCPLDDECWTVFKLLLEDWEKIFTLDVIASVSREDVTTHIIDPTSLSPLLRPLCSSKQPLHVSISHHNCRSLAVDYWNMQSLPFQIAQATKPHIVEALRKKLDKLESTLRVTKYEVARTIQTRLTKTL